jgi:hypothetical protein
MSNKFFDTQKDESEIVNRISYSQWKTYRTCPKQWELKYKQGLRPPDESIYFVFGTASHEALQLYIRKMYSETVKKANQIGLKDRFQSLLKEEYDNRKEAFEEKYPGREFPVTKKEMVQFAKDGKAIIESFKRNRQKHFPKEETDLVGIEEKVEQKVQEGVAWVGYLDVVLRNRKTGKYKIIDLKTSTDGWDKWKKREKKRTDQLVAYKSFYADKLGISPDQIEIEYLIMKRELDSKYESRFQQYSPPSGKKARERVKNKIEEFLDDCFTENGEYKEKDYTKEPDKFTCCFCPYSEDFGEEGYQECDQDETRFLDYPESMRPYIPDKFVGPQPK